MKRHIKNQRKKIKNNKRGTKSQKHRHPCYPLQTDSTVYIYKNGEYYRKIVQTDVSNEPSYNFPTPKKQYDHKFTAYQSFIDWIKALSKTNDVLGDISFKFDKDGNCTDVNGTKYNKEYLESFKDSLSSYGFIDPTFYACIFCIYDSFKIFYSPDSFYVNTQDKYLYGLNFEGQPKGFLECENGLVVPIIPNSVVYVANLDSGYFNPNDVLKILNAGYKITNTSDLDWKFTNISDLDWEFTSIILDNSENF